MSSTKKVLWATGVVLTALAIFALGGEPVPAKPDTQPAATPLAKPTKAPVSMATTSSAGTNTTKAAEPAATAPKAAEPKATEPRAFAAPEAERPKPQTASSRPAPVPVRSAGGDRDCSDFGSHEEAQRFFLANGGPSSDPHKLDRDHDGLACESI
jgi:hypothetical protein